MGMWKLETIAVIFDLTTGVTGLLIIRPGEYQRRLQSTSAVFRRIHYGALWALVIWSVVSLGLHFFGSQTSAGMRWLSTLFMVSWWPLILNLGNSPANANSG
jgi:hypothetical protein